MKSRMDGAGMMVRRGLLSAGEGVEEGVAEGVATEDAPTVEAGEAEDDWEVGEAAAALRESGGGCGTGAMPGGEEGAGRSNVVSDVVRDR